MTGLGKKKYTPSSTARLTACWLQNADMTITFLSPGSSASWRRMPKPSSPGSTTSIRISSGFVRRTSSMTIGPSPVDAATSNSPVSSSSCLSKMRNSSFASASSTLVLFSIASNPFPQFAPPPPNVLQPFPFVVQLVYNLSYLSDSFKIIVSKNPLKNASHIKNPLKPMKNTTKISPGVLSMPGDIVTHASFNFRRSVRYLPLQEPIQLRLHVLPVLHLRRTVKLPVGHDQLYMAQRP